MSTTVRLEDEGHTACHIMLFTEVENAIDLRQIISKGQLNASLIRAEMVVGVFPLVVAANKALRAQNTGKMVTRTIHSEIIFNLSPSKNISESLKTFGLGDLDQAVVAVVLEGKKKEGVFVEKLKSQIKGKLTDLSELSSLSDEGQVRTVYKISDTELTIGSLVEAVTTRVACKDFLSL